MTRVAAMLRLLTYLAPGIPLGLYEAIGDYLAARLDVDVVVASDPSRSGPGPGSADPFADGDADVGFVCAPSYLWMAALPSPSVALAGVAPIHSDPRNEGRPEYYSELVVHENSPARSFDDLAGRRFAYNDRSSLSGYHCVLDRLMRDTRDASFFSDVRCSGSHERSLGLIAAREIDVAAIDANALVNIRDMGFDLGVRVIETLGPYPVQPVVVATQVPADRREAIRDALLEMHFASGGEPLKRFGVERFGRVDDNHYRSVRDHLQARGALP
jgi:ABC-type phosphate/phosphonate transport system substrate-binding protein